MSKLVYPEKESLVNLVRGPLNDTISSLNTAIGQCSFVVPNDFAYLSYLRTLSTTIAEYRGKVYEIFGDIDKIDVGYRNAFDTMSSYKESLDLNVIDERDRLVK